MLATATRSQHRFIWGVRLVVLTDERGLPLGYTLVSASEHEYEPLADLLTGTPSEVVVADRGFGDAPTPSGWLPMAYVCSPRTERARPRTADASTPRRGS
jgi:Transposase DDE domain